MWIRWVFWLILITGLSRGTLALLQENGASDLLKTADEMVQKVAQLRGLEPKAPIQKGIKNREEISKFLGERVNEEYEIGELEAEGKMLCRLGLIPPAVDYEKFMLKLLTEQVGGYYDSKEKTLFIASWLPAAEQRPVLVHEITHALQDQHFDIDGILRQDRKLHNYDRVLAHQAVFEGDGMAVMLNFLLEPAGRNFAELPDMAFIMRAQFSSMQSQFAVFKSAPLYLQETLLFPYGNGASFLQRVWTKKPSWQAVNDLYSHLPASTEQIIHPEKYFTSNDRPKPVKFEDPAARLGTDWGIAYRNVLGEFSLNLLLRSHLQEEKARRSVCGWGGDEVLLLENRAGEDAVFVATVWDTPEDADKFYEALNEWFQLSYPEARRAKESPNGYSLIHEEEVQSIWHEGSDVRFIVGLPESDSRSFDP